MTEMDREEKIEIIYNILGCEYTDSMVKEGLPEKILDAIESLEIETGMLGRFWDNDTKSFPMYGCLAEIRSSEVPGNYKTTTEHIFDNFRPMAPKEIADDIRNQMEEKE